MIQKLERYLLDLWYFPFFLTLQRQWEGKQCIQTDKEQGGFSWLVFQGFGLISVSSSFCLSLFSGDRIEASRALPKTGGWGGGSALQQWYEGSHLFLFHLLKRSKGDLLPTYEFLHEEETPGTKKLWSTRESCNKSQWINAEARHVPIKNKVLGSFYFVLLCLRKPGWLSKREAELTGSTGVSFSQHLQIKTRILSGRKLLCSVKGQQGQSSDSCYASNPIKRLENV